MILNSTKKYTEICDGFGGVTNKAEDLTLVVSGVCPGDSDELSTGDKFNGKHELSGAVCTLGILNFRLLVRS